MVAILTILNFDSIQSYSRERQNQRAAWFDRCNSRVICLGGRNVEDCLNFLEVYNWIDYSDQEMELLYDNRLVNQIVTRLFKHRRNDYSEHSLEHQLNLLELQHRLLPVANPRYEKLCVSLFSKGPIQGDCLLFLHGYGSNRLECLNLLPFVEEGFALCSLDFSGSGKSEGDRVTYGVQEKFDIDCTLNYLRKLGYSRFILWGRSMGATAALLYSSHFRPIDVMFMVLDSPFFSFELIAFEIASRHVKAPQFLISFALEMAKKNCSRLQGNPFEIQLSSTARCSMPALFVYCEEDSVVSPQNTHKICQHYGSTFQKLVIHQNHNTLRTSQTLTKIISFLRKYLKYPGKARGNVQFNPYCLDLTHQISHNSDKIKKMQSEVPSTSMSSKLRQSRKGIGRVEAPQQLNDYGIWVASKIKDQEVEKVRRIGGRLGMKGGMKDSRAGRSSLSVSSCVTWEERGSSLKSLGGSQLHNSRYL